MLLRAIALIIFATILSVSKIAAQQILGSPAAFYQMINSDLTRLKTPSRSLHAIAYGNLYAQEMPAATDSIIRGFFSGGNTDWERVYERGTGRLREERRFRDNDRHEMISSNVPDDTRRSYTIEYDSTGMKTISWVENGIPKNRSFKRILNEQGRVARETRYFNGGEEYDYAFTYNTRGNKIQEQHFSGSYLTDTYLYRYNRQGLLVQEIRQKADGKTDLMMTYQYDGRGRLVRTDYFRNPNALLEEYTLIHYDAAGNKIEEATYYADGRTDSHRYFEYNKAGELVKKSWTNPVDYDELIVYDDAGNAVCQASLRETHRRLFSNGLLIRDSIFRSEALADVHVFQYDQRGRLLVDSSAQLRSLYFYGSCSGPDSLVDVSFTNYRQKTTITYNATCLPVEKKTVFREGHFDYKHGKYVNPPPPVIFRYYYDPKGRLISEVKIDEKDSVYFQIRWTYGTDGTKTAALYVGRQQAANCVFGADGLIGYFSKDRGGGSRETHTYSYAWDNQGNWIRRDEAITGRYGWTEHTLALRNISY